MVEQLQRELHVDVKDVKMDSSSRTSTVVALLDDRREGAVRVRGRRGGCGDTYRGEFGRLESAGPKSLRGVGDANLSEESKTSPVRMNKTSMYFRTYERDQVGKDCVHSERGGRDIAERERAQ